MFLSLYLYFLSLQVRWVCMLFFFFFFSYAAAHSHTCTQWQLDSARYTQSFIYWSPGGLTGTVALAPITFESEILKVKQLNTENSM